LSRSPASARPRNSRPQPDRLLQDIADYVLTPATHHRTAYARARHCLMDALGCAFAALQVPECMRHIGPVVAGTQVPNGARVPGTPFVLDPLKAAFDISCLIRWLDYSDTWVTGGHPSDNIGAILALADYLAQQRSAARKPPLTMRAVLQAMIRAYEVQGRLANEITLDDPGIGIDATFFVKVASTAAAAYLLGCNRDETVNALSQAFVDGHSLNIYRLGSNAGARKCWAAADASSRGLWFALLAARGEMGYPSALTAPAWGFESVLLDGKALPLPASYDDHVMRNILFKIAYPAQRHAQTAAECAVRLHEAARARVADISSIEITTHALAQRMISNTGPLPNFAARDHCLQYIVAVALLHGDITHASYEDACAADPRIELLRGKTRVLTDTAYTAAYEDPVERANPAAVQVFFDDGSHTEKVAVHFPIGDPHRWKEGLPLLEAKFRRNLALHFPPGRQAGIAAILAHQGRLEATPVHEFMQALTT